MRSRPVGWLAWIGALTLLSMVLPRPLEGIPAFARKYRVTCSLCHQPFPRLNAFGETFAGNGFQFTIGETPSDTLAVGDPLLRLQRAIPLAVRIDAYVTALTEGSDVIASDLQMPYNIKVLSGGQITDRISYYLYFFLSERGEVAGLEDAYVQFTDIAGTGVGVIAGQFQVSDPLFKRELRLEVEDYALYRMRMGEARADLTYDRGFLAFWSPREGTDLSAQVVNGSGLREAESNRRFDQDQGKNVMGRLSQDLGFARIGAFAYTGRERSDGILDDILIWGVDGTLPVGSTAELNVQYLRRRDGNPFFLDRCEDEDTRCDASSADPLEAKADGLMAELLYAPSGVLGRWHLYGLYNRVWADRPVFTVRLGEQASGPVDRYETAGLGGSYLVSRNFRFVGELMRDIERERTRMTLGFVTAF